MENPFLGARTGPTVTRTLLPGHLVFVKYANIGLGRLTIRTCRVHSGEDLSVFKGVVKEVEWSDLGEEGSNPVSWEALDDHIWGCRHCFRYNSSDRDQILACISRGT